MSGSKTTHAKFRVSVLVTSVAVGVASLAQLPARPTSAAAATLSGSKGPGPSESSGRIPALPAASSVAARVAPLVMAPGVFDTATAKPRVFPAPAALPAGVVGEVSDRRTLRDEKATTVQLGAAVGDVKLPGQIVTVARPGLERLGIDAAIFGAQLREFGKLFCHVAGIPKSVSDARSLKSRRRFYQRRPAQEMAGT